MSDHDAKPKADGAESAGLGALHYTAHRFDQLRKLDAGEITHPGARDFLEKSGAIKWDKFSKKWNVTDLGRKAIAQWTAPNAGDKLRAKRIILATDHPLRHYDQTCPVCQKEQS